MNTIDIIINKVKDFAKRYDWSREEQAAFLAQIEHESNHFQYKKELSYSAKRAFEIFPHKFKTLRNALNIYEKYGADGLFDVMYYRKNGNIYPNDGSKFKGRGWIQITGRINYQLIKDITGLDVIKDPSLLETDENATLASLVWWQNNVHGKVKSYSNTEMVTLLVNGPAKLGLSERNRMFLKWIKII